MNKLFTYQDKSLDPKDQMQFIYITTHRMTHKLTALILSCLMLVVSATSQVGLHFCLCEKTVFMGDCPCAETSVKLDASPYSCCESCDITETEMPDPCDDCNLTIELTINDYVPQLGADFKINSEFSTLPYQSFVANEVLCPASNEMLLLEISRGPPPCLLSATTPLYLKHSVFLI